MTFTSIFTISIFVINIFLALIIVFIGRKSSSSTWAWLFVLLFLPVVGFILYILLGRNLRKKNFVRWRMLHEEEALDVFLKQKKKMQEDSFRFPNKITDNHQQLIQMNVDYNHAILTTHNHVDMIIDGKEKFRQVIADIEKAQNHIHMQYYIFKMDETGKSIYDALVKKANEGVEVKVIYDDLGSRKLKKKHFQTLINAGGEVEAFFSTRFALFNPRINFRNHRKLIIIDGKLGYIGGFNIGNEYAGLDKRFGYWRDTHLRITGHSVYSMQTHFLFDWHQAGNIPFNSNRPEYFPKFVESSTIPIQIVSSGPDTAIESIKDSYIRMILTAKKYVYIESPYFIPDQAFLNAIRIAAASGVDVRVITPAKTDHPFVYGGNSAYGGDLLQYGGRLYRYDKGFLHAKMMVVDDEICTIGTTNIDVRSFSLNFEINAIIYDEDIAKQCRELFEQDLSNSFEVTSEMYAQRNLWTRIRESVSRLLAPIL